MRLLATFVLPVSSCLVASWLVLAGCKPSASPGANPASNPPQNSTSPGIAGPRAQPSTSDLANFLRGVLPSGAVRVVEVKNDPPVPLPNVVPGTNAWLFTVRLTLAPAEDLFLPAPAQDTQALQTMLDELKTLADWSQAYADSPYTDFGAPFTIKVPASIAPQLLTIAHPREQPLAPIYGKMAAEWQVDH